MSEIISMIPNREFKLNELSKVNSSASEIDDSVASVNLVIRNNKNMYDKTTTNTSGFINVDGGITAHATAVHSDFIEVVGNKEYTYQGAYGQTTRLAFYDSSKTFISVYPIGGTSVVASANDTITTPLNCKYIRFTIRNVGTFMVEVGNAQSAYESFGSVKINSEYLATFPIANKNVLCFGDSITSNLNGWINSFTIETGVFSIQNYAISGQKIAWRAGTVETITPPIDGHDNNVLWNSILKFKSNAPFTPDIIIIAEGTNDISQHSPLGSYIDAFAQKEALTDNMTMANAFRKALYKLETLYPLAQIFYCTPIQSKTGGRNYANMTEVGNINREVARRMGVNVIEMTAISGIVDEFENVSAAGKYLYDGVHPNADGRSLMGRVIAKEVSTKYRN